MVKKYNVFVGKSLFYHLIINLTQKMNFFPSRLPDMKAMLPLGRDLMISPTNRISQLAMGYWFLGCNCGLFIFYSPDNRGVWNFHNLFSVIPFQFNFFIIY